MRRFCGNLGDAHEDCQRGNSLNLWEDYSGVEDVARIFTPIFQICFV